MIGYLDLAYWLLIAAVFWLGKLSERHSRKAVKAEYDWWRSEIVDHSPEPGFRRAGL